MPAQLGEFAVAYVIFLFSVTLHEYGHARVGHFFGSRLATDEGLVTLDPIPHIRRSPVGMVVMPVVSVFLFNWTWPMGWASVPYDPYWGQRHPQQKAWMSLAGPGANFLLALLALIAIHVLIGSGQLVPAPGPSLSHLLDAADGESRSVMGALAFGLPTLMFLNIMLGMFNMLPIPPLDGASVVEGFFPNQLSRLYSKLQEQPLIGLVLFVIAFKYAWYLVEPVMVFVARTLL
jgi:Zn-dependent protease